MPFLASCQERGRERLAVGLGGGGAVPGLRCDPRARLAQSDLRLTVPSSQDYMFFEKRGGAGPSAVTS